MNASVTDPYRILVTEPTQSTKTEAGSPEVTP